MDTLPLELFDGIVSRLNLIDLRNLRLTSRSINNQTIASPNFICYFHNATVSVTSSAVVNLFTGMIHPHRLGHHIRHVTLKYVVKDITWDGSDLHCQRLTSAFNNIRLFSIHGHLRRLTLDVETSQHVCKDFRSHWRSCWFSDQATSDTEPCSTVLHAFKSLFTVACQSIYASGLVIHTFNAFGPGIRCNMENYYPQDTQSSPILRLHMSQSITALRSLSLRLFTDVHDGPSPKDDDSLVHCVIELSVRGSDVRGSRPSQTSQAARSLAWGIRNLIESCACLEVLEIDHRNIHQATHASTSQTQKWCSLGPLVGTVVPTRLRRLSLKRVRTSEADLLSLMTRTVLLTELIMEHVYLHNGDFCQLFVRIGSQLSFLHLDDLRAPRQLLFYASDKIGRMVDEATGTQSLTRKGLNAARPIVYNMVE
ncbi:hypothetical protein ANO11243_066640 [Dothideomycetidae sp. 11243]|nr:hypothetical protein ANO11243_066640 [fungal sp. No.11243]